MVSRPYKLPKKWVFGTHDEDSGSGLPECPDEQCLGAPLFGIVTWDDELTRLVRRGDGWRREMQNKYAVGCRTPLRTTWTSMSVG